VADGQDVRDLVPPNEPIRVIHYAGKLSIGTKRNLGCAAAMGDLIAHFDDDDFSGPDRLADQIDGMQATGAAVVGYHAMRFTDGAGWWQYRGAPLGTSLMYRKSWWQEHPFQTVQVNEDGRFCDEARGADALATEDAGNLMWATIHPSNTSPRQLEGSAWSQI